MRIREALRMRASGFNNSQIARSVTVQLARSTVVELFRRCDAHKITYEMARYRQGSFAHLSYLVVFGDPPPGGRVPERGATLCPLFLHHFFFHGL